MLISIMTPKTVLLKALEIVTTSSPSTIIALANGSSLAILTFTLRVKILVMFLLRSLITMWFSTTSSSTTS